MVRMIMVYIVMVYILVAFVVKVYIAMLYIVVAARWNLPNPELGCTVIVYVLSIVMDVSIPPCTCLHTCQCTYLCSGRPECLCGT